MIPFVQILPGWKHGPAPFFVLSWTATSLNGAARNSEKLLRAAWGPFWQTQRRSERPFSNLLFSCYLYVLIIDKYWIVLISILYFFYLLLIMSWVLGQNHSRSMDQGGRFPQLNMNEDLLNFSCGTWILHTTHLPGKFGWTSSGFPWAVGAGGAVLEIPLVCCWWNLMTHLKPAVPMFFCTQTLWSEHLAHSQSVAWVLCRIQWK